MDNGHKFTDEKIALMEKEITKIFFKVLKEVQQQATEVFINIQFMDKDTDPLKYYKEINKYNRLNKLIDKLAIDISKANELAIKFMNGELLNIYYENYNYEAYDIEQQAEIGLNMYIGYNQYVIKELIMGDSNPFELIALESYLDKKQIVQQLKTEFTEGFLKGEGLQKLLQRVQKVIDRNYNQAIRIARTESTRIQNSARLDAFKTAEKQGLKLAKKWSATSDSRTRKSHLRADGQIVDLDQKFKVGNSELRYPGDYLGGAKEVINCRCTMLTEFIGFTKTELEKDLDRQVEKMKYEEWKRREEEKIKK